MFFLIFICMNAQTFLQAQPEPEWNYEELGPDTWFLNYPACGGNMQSPINMPTSNAAFDPSLNPINFNNHNISVTWNVANNGKEIIAQLAESVTTKLDIDGSDFKEKYNFLQFHFHWGRNNYQGSEHQVNDKKYPLELNTIDNPRLNPLLDIVGTLTVQGANRNVNLRLTDILPPSDQLLTYYRYNGSFTTPPCTPGIIFNIFNRPISISSFQLQKFRTNSIKFNFRDTQPLNNRRITKSWC